MTTHPSPECCDLAELENSNLRKCLAWAGARLSIDDRRLLVEMIKHPVTKGGVLEDGREDDRRDLIECEKHMRRMVDHIQKAIDTKSMIPSWWIIADQLCCRAREWEPDKQEPTLHELRELFPQILKLPLAHGKTHREQGGSSV
jgi:hypothetical protein